MLIKLLPNQVSDNWEIIKKAIEDSLPPEIYDGHDIWANILENILSGYMDVWVSVKDGKTRGIVVTAITGDIYAGVKMMLVYAIKSFSKYDGHDGWNEDFEVLRKHAVANGCKCVVASTRSKSIIKYALDNGWRFHSVELLYEV